MSPVLDIDNLLESPLSDLHAIAGELDIEGYRLLRKADLTIAILESRGAVADEIRPAVEAKAAEVAKLRAEREEALARAEEAEAKEREESRAAAASERARGGRPAGRAAGEGGRRRREGGSQATSGRGRDGRARGGERESSNRGGRGSGRGGQKAGDSGGRDERTEGGSKEQDRVPKPTTPLAGVFEPGSGGGGRLRTDMARRVRGDADIPRGEVRRWNLRRGDLIEAKVKKSRRGRTDFVVDSIDRVNGVGLEDRKKPAQAFEEREAAAIAGRYAKKTFKYAPIGAGSRLVVTGPTRAAASSMLQKLAGELASAGVVTTLVVVSARPEQSLALDGVEVIAGDAAKEPGAVLPALELALDRDRRLAETGRETALLVDGLDLLDATKAAEIFTSARNLADGGALTLAAAAGSGSSLEALATAIGVVSGGRKPKLDKKSSWSA